MIPEQIQIWQVVGKSDAVFKELEESSDRTVAIMSAAILEEHLLAAIKRFIVNDDKVDERLFGINGPIGSFSNRAKFAYLTSMISQRVFQDIENIAKVRNRFAHRLDAVSLSEQPMREICMNLSAPDYMTRDTNDESPPGFGQGLWRRTDLVDMDGQITKEPGGVPRTLVSMSIVNRQAHLSDPRWRYEATVIVLGAALMDLHPGLRKPPRI